ncbi:MAG: hypothetical protein HC877_05360 [Thioploca sp.]|nr:hypothetical protein [Thioploca sp.]
MNILVIGKAKTGTTVISKTIQKSISGPTQYHLEPKRIGFFEQEHFAKSDCSHIVKIIFEHWSNTPRMRNAIIHNEAVLKFDKVICIVRDLRDEIISRLMYLIYPYQFEYHLKAEQVAAWLDILEKKEKSPQSIAFVELFAEFEKIFKVSFSGELNHSIMQSKIYYDFIQGPAKNSYRIKYEDFITGKLQLLEEYFGFSVSSDRTVDDLERTKRSVTFNNWKKIFTAEDVEFFKPKLSLILEKFGYLDWELEESDKLESEHYSGYVKHLLNPNPNKIKSLHICNNDIANSYSIPKIGEHNNG